MYIRRWIFVCLILFVTAGCGTDSSLERLRGELDQYPEYSVVLEDMRSEGFLFHDYFHRYRLVYPKEEGQAQTGDAPNFEQKVTDWIKTDKKTYDTYENSLGMVILAKKTDGTIENVPQPMGYQYVGDTRYGQWKEDNQGNNFWEWYGKYALLAQVVDEVGDFLEKRHHHRIGYNDWKDYRGAASRGTPYFGKKDEHGRSQFGTQGTVTEKSNPSFFQRQQARMAERKASFGDKVKSRIGRSKVSSAHSRSSSGSSGK